MEVWKDIENYEGYYQVSNKGNVRTLKRTIVNSLGRTRVYKPRTTKKHTRPNGYMYVELSKDNAAKKLSISRLVAFAFIELDINRNDVNHINGIKKDNRSENLEWVTPSENTIHSYRIGIRPKYHKGRKIIMLDKKGNVLNEFKSIASATRSTGVHKTGIGRACRGEYTQAGGYNWKYKTD